MATKAKADFLIEVSWEVCNKVGGIYTVITSKVMPMQDYYKDNYMLIGPYFDEKARGVFNEEVLPDEYKQMCAELEKIGIFCHYGTWNTQGTPTVILIDFLKCYSCMNQIKADLWNNYMIDSLRAGQDYDEPIVWAWAVGKVIEKLAGHMKDKKIVTHFHEWMAGVGLLELKKNKTNVATVFTTHATILGRTLASSEVDLYGGDKGSSFLKSVDPVKAAYDHHIEAKYLVEAACANNASVFTTVSEITGIEASYLLKKKPDILLPNGMDMNRFSSFEDLSIQHIHNKHHIREFIMTYFFPHYTWDLDDTLIYFLAGRYEFRDKGIDVYIKALAQLNDRLKKEKSSKTIVAFIWVPAGVRGIKKDLLMSRTLFNDIKESVHNRRNIIENNIIYNVMLKKELNTENILGKDAVTELKIKTGRFAVGKGVPALCTHDLFDENDRIKNTLNSVGLDNQQDDKVKVVFYPIYLTGADNLLDLNYYQSINGSHLGIFPSFYEPWGYTPLETGALGVASATTDLAGFGRFIQKQKKDKNRGIFVLERLNKSDDEIISSLAQFMYWFQTLSHNDRVRNKIEARRLAELADWRILVEQYIKAHNLAVKRAFRT